jgi:hypothetical protein
MGRIAFRLGFVIYRMGAKETRGGSGQRGRRESEGGVRLLAIEAMQFGSMVPTPDIRRGIETFLSRRK